MIDSRKSLWSGIECVPYVQVLGHILPQVRLMQRNWLGVGAIVVKVIYQVKCNGCRNITSTTVQRISNLPGEYYVAHAGKIHSGVQ